MAQAGVAAWLGDTGPILRMPTIRNVSNRSPLDNGRDGPLPPGKGTCKNFKKFQPVPQLRRRWRTSTLRCGVKLGSRSKEDPRWLDSISEDGTTCRLPTIEQFNRQQRSGGHFGPFWVWRGHGEPPAPCARIVGLEPVAGSYPRDRVAITTVEGRQSLSQRPERDAAGCCAAAVALENKICA